MKTLFLIACLSSYMGSAFAKIKSDTIIINVGSKKKVIIYGETKADLRELEKIDLNKALKEMNKGLAEMTTKTSRMVVKDYNGKTYKLDTPQINLTKWKYFTKKTNINLHVAALDMGYYDASFTGANSYRYETFDGGGAINFGVSILHSNIKKFNNHLAFAFRKGIQYNFYRAESSIPGPANVIGGLSGDPENFKLEGAKRERIYADSKNNSIIQTFTLKNGIILKSQALPRVHTFGVLSAELQPTFYFLNKKGQSTFSFSPGGFVGFKMHQIERTNYLNLSIGDNERGGRSSTKSLENFGNLNAGIQLDFAYKIFHLFWRQNLYSTFGISTAMIADPIVSDVYLKKGEGRIRFTTIGIRIGR
ncbi:MAG: hypothetical protein U5M51_05925 [Emticicia sp.]|nr:hypothetical protein [Emticicia sp.]